MSHRRSIADRCRRRRRRRAAPSRPRRAPPTTRRPSNPSGGADASPRARSSTLKVCKSQEAKRCFPTIQTAVNAAKPATRSRSPTAPTARASRSSAPAKRYIKLDRQRRSDPTKVVLEGKGLKGAAAQNGVSDQRRRRGHGQGLHRPALQGQRLLRRQRRPATRSRTCGAIPGRRLRRLRVQLDRRLDDRLRGVRGTTTRASTSARRRRRPSRCARSSRTSSPTATCSAARARTCAT